MPDLAAWLNEIPAASPLAFALVAVAGLAVGVAPSSLPMMSVIVGWTAARGDDEPGTGRARALLLSLGFVLGMATVDTAVGALSGPPWLAAALLLTFGLARGLPIAVAGTAAGSVKHLRRLAPWVPRIEKGGGALLLAAAVYFLYQSGVYRGLLLPLEAMV